MYVMVGGVWLCRCRIVAVVVVILDSVWKWYDLMLVKLGVLSDDEAQGGRRSSYLYPARRIPESSRYCLLLIMIGSSSRLFIFPLQLIVHRIRWQYLAVSRPFPPLWE